MNYSRYDFSYLVFVMFYAIDIFTYESFFKPLQENAKLDKSFIQSIASAGVSPDISTLKDHKTRQQVAQEVVENK